MTVEIHRQTVTYLLLQMLLGFANRGRCQCRYLQVVEFIYMLLVEVGAKIPTCCRTVPAEVPVDAYIPTCCSVELSRKSTAAWIPTCCRIV